MVVLDPPVGRLGVVRGRDGLLNLLALRLSSPSGDYQVLAGLGGVGKTTVALALAEVATSEGHLSWWVSGADAPTLLASMMALAAGLGAPPGQVAEAYSGSRNPADVLWEQLRQHSGWLLVIDNADSVEEGLGGRTVADGTGWLRRCTEGLVVVTSRASGRESWGRYGEVHRLQPLGEADGAQVLLDHAGSGGTAADAARLSARLGGLPLALHHAGSYLASPFAPDRSLSRYLESIGGWHPGQAAAGTGQDPAVLGTWEASLDSLATQGRGQARALLAVLACFAPSAPIPLPLVDHAILGEVCGAEGEVAVQPGLEALLSVGLVDVQAAEQWENSFAVTVHPLVAQASRRHPRPEIAVTAARLLEKATGTLKHDLPADWPRWGSLVQHLGEMLLVPPQVLGEHGTRLLAQATARTCYALTWSGSYGRAEALASPALGCAGSLGHTREVSHLRFQQTMAIAFQGRHAEAEAGYRDLAASLASAVGPRDPQVIKARFEAAHETVQQGYYAQAEEELSALIPEMSTVLGPEDQSTMQARSDLGLAIARQGRHAEAEEELREAFAIQAQTLGQDHQRTLSTRTWLADIQASRGHHTQAKAMLEDILAARLRVFGPDYPFTLATRRKLASVIARMDQQAAAEDELRNVISDQARVLGDDHPDTLESRYELATILARQGRAKEAISQLQTLLADQSRIFGAASPPAAASRNLRDALLPPASAK